MKVIVHPEIITTPVGNPAQWITVTGNDRELKRAGYVAGAAARKIAKSMAPGTRAAWITGGWTLGPDHFESRTLYVFFQE